MTTVCTSLLRCSQNFSGVHIVSPVFTSFLLASLLEADTDAGS